MSSKPNGPNIRWFAQRWLRDYPRERSTEYYEAGVRPFVESHGHLRMGDITRQQARQECLASSYRGLCLTRMFEDAVSDDYIARNPFRGIKLPQAKKRVYIPTVEDVERLAETALGDVEWTTRPLSYREGFSRLIRFAAYTGLRRGELLGAMVMDVADDELRVERQLLRSGEFSPPKTDGGYRTIVMPPQALAQLPPLDGLHPQHRLFADFNHYAMGKCGIWRRVRHYAGLEGLPFHSLRHFCATWMLDNGLPPWDIADHLGHRDNGKLVMATYGHPDQRKARERIRRTFDPTAA